ncbi:MAG: hypothetical protein IPF74_15670 [Rhodocyclaceae bacterium]|nr:hypothetical protein [Rhodocyclaceae bacterium]
MRTSRSDSRRTSLQALDRRVQNGVALHQIERQRARVESQPQHQQADGGGLARRVARRHGGFELPAQHLADALVDDIVDRHRQRTAAGIPTQQLGNAHAGRRQGVDHFQLQRRQGLAVRQQPLTAKVGQRPRRPQR